MLDLIRSGDLERLIIVVLIFGTLCYLWATHAPVDDRLMDVAFVVLGFFFRDFLGKLSRNGAQNGK